MEWINVKNKLPYDFEYVLVYVKLHDEHLLDNDIYPAIYAMNEFTHYPECDCQTDDNKIENVLFWMPMPDAPSED